MEKKMIALVSFHHEYNYGTMLQAYALSQKINDLGFKSEYISYKSTLFSIRISNLKFLFKKLYSNPLSLLNRFLPLKLKFIKPEFLFWQTSEFENTAVAFETFYSKYIPHTAILYDHKTIRNVLTNYVKYIVGSDQTWSPYMYVPTSLFFLDFVNNGASKNSYAPSIGTPKIPNWFRKILKNKLITFDHLSCRDRKGCQELTNLLGVDVKYVLDPTLLMTSIEWDKIASPLPIFMPDKYVLCYILGEKECISEFAEKLGEEKGMPVYYIVTRPYYLKKKNKLMEVDPSIFLSLIKNASYICTDSFHGTAFSINYEKNFYSFTKRMGHLSINDNSRIVEFLRELNLLDRFKEDVDFSFSKDIDYFEVRYSLDILRKESLSFLRKIVQ